MYKTNIYIIYITFYKIHGKDYQIEGRARWEADCPVIIVHILCKGLRKGFCSLISKAEMKLNININLIINTYQKSQMRIFD